MPEAFDFEALAGLKNYLASIRRNHVPTMNHYASSDGMGFWHQPSKRDHASLSSTATCVSSLVRAGLWNQKDRKWGQSSDVAKRLLKTPWESAGLLPNNPFGLSFIAEGVLDLIKAEPYDNRAEHESIIRSQIFPLLLGEIEKADGRVAIFGSVRISPYPPSAYLTQLAFRVLKRCSADNATLTEKIVRAVRAWAIGEIHRQVALISTGSRIADPLQLAYAIVLASSATADEQTSPEEKALVREALRIFFDAQSANGMWPLSQPLFHYPDVGNAHCFEYELLTQLLNCEPLQDELLLYLPRLEVTASRLKHTLFNLGTSSTGAAVGWASGHHPQIEGPESWSTACVYDFVHSLDRLVAEAIRQTLFAELRAIYVQPQSPLSPPKKPDEFADGFLDAKLVYRGDTLSLRDALRDRFVVPIAERRADVANGGSLPKTTPMSAILFGPPGTSKTMLAEHISTYLGWPLLSVDPSYLVQDGLDQLYARANKLFSMLSMTEQVVALLDEFDEMGRDREKEHELLSRFITTSMLPKLAAINKERKIVFLLATNYVSKFDAAFSRGGRFDMVLQVMQPTLEAKLQNPSWKNILDAALGGLKGKKLAEARECLSDLTYLETVELVTKLDAGVDDVSAEFVAARAQGTLKKRNGEKDWGETSIVDQSVIRLPVVKMPAAVKP